MFTQQHYIEIAKTLRKQKLRFHTEKDRLIWAAICRDFMVMLKKDNERFDRDKFINYIITGK